MAHKNLNQQQRAAYNQSHHHHQHQHQHQQQSQQQSQQQQQQQQKDESVLLCTSGYDRQIRFWEAPTGICNRQISTGDSQVNVLVISPDKKFLAAGGNPNIKLYSIIPFSREPVKYRQTSPAIYPCTHCLYVSYILGPNIRTTYKQCNFHWISNTSKMVIFSIRRWNNKNMG